MDGHLTGASIIVEKEPVMMRREIFKIDIIYILFKAPKRSPDDYLDVKPDRIPVHH